MLYDTQTLYENEHEIERLTQWVHDLQSGMYINCVYCGYRFGPSDEVPATMADALKAHIEQCEKHPMSALKAELERLKKKMHRWQASLAFYAKGHHYILKSNYWVLANRPEWRWLEWNDGKIDAIEDGYEARIALGTEYKSDKQ